MQKNPDYDAYPDLSVFTKEMLANIVQVKEWHIGPDYDEGEDLIPEEITDVCFVFPYDDWDEISMDEAFCKSIEITTGE